MSEPSLTMLVMSDLHYTGLARQSAQSHVTRGELARTLLEKVFRRLELMGVKPDLTVLLGDVVENSEDQGADLDLVGIHCELAKSNIPFIAIPGNHDGAAEKFNAVMGSEPGLHKVGGYGFLVFNDSYNERHETTRESEWMAMTREVARENPDLPLVAVQHSPVYPPVDSGYPYRPLNAADIMESYKSNGVFLSVSGHLHKGERIRARDNTLYYTVPALCRRPFSFALIRLKGRRAEVEELSLAFDLPNLNDFHCHTGLSYCATTADAPVCIALSKALGISTLCVIEHTFQLYFERRIAMGFKWQSDSGLVDEVWQSPERGRMAMYRRYAEKLRMEGVKIGLEVDLFDNGRLLLAPEDEKGWDLLVGAIHAIADYEPGVTTQEEAEELFMRDVAHLIDSPITILAHPFRFFRWAGLEVPRHLYEEVAELLVEGGVAAEINFHRNTPDPEFFKICIERGVKLALGTDTHATEQAGELWPHVNLLRGIGVNPNRYPEVLLKL